MLVTGKVPFPVVIKNAEGKKLSVFLSDYDEANGCPLRTAIGISALDIDSNYFCRNLKRCSHRRSDDQTDNLVQGKLPRTAKQCAAGTHIYSFALYRFFIVYHHNRPLYLRSQLHASLVFSSIMVLIFCEQEQNKDHEYAYENPTYRRHLLEETPSYV